MQTKFDVGADVLIKAKVHSIKINKDHLGNPEELYYLEIPGSGLSLLTIEESHLTDKDEIVNEVANEAVVKMMESNNSTYPKALNCCCDMNPKGGV